MQGLIETSNRGTKITAKGKGICEGLLSAIPAEMSLPKCSVALSMFNYALLVREFSFAVGLGPLRLPYNHLAIACVQAYGAIKINLAVIII
jgi:hypothetical protein